MAALHSIFTYVKFLKETTDNVYQIETLVAWVLELITISTLHRLS